MREKHDSASGLKKYTILQVSSPNSYYDTFSHVGHFKAQMKIKGS